MMNFEGRFSDGEHLKCPNCGYVAILRGWTMVLAKCPKCDGSGEIGSMSLLGLVMGGDRDTCPLCKGTGYADDGSIRFSGSYDVHHR